MMDEHGKSDSSVVPEKSPNKVWEQAAEAMEERGLAKGNRLERNAPQTQRRISTPSALELVRQAAGATARHYLRQEPYEVIPHVRICAGGAG